MFGVDQVGFAKHAEAACVRLQDIIEATRHVETGQGLGDVDLTVGA